MVMGGERPGGGLAGGRRHRAPVPIELPVDGRAALFVFDAAGDEGACHIALTSVARALATVIADAPGLEAVLRSGTLLPVAWLSRLLGADSFRPARFVVGVETARHALRTLLRRWSRRAPRTAARGALVDVRLGDWLEARAVIRDGCCTVPAGDGPVSCGPAAIAALLRGVGLPTRTMDRWLLQAWAEGHAI